VAALGVGLMWHLLVTQGLAMSRKQTSDTQEEFQFLVGMILGLCYLHLGLEWALSSTQLVPGTTKGSRDATTKEAQEKQSTTARSQCVAYLLTGYPPVLFMAYVGCTTCAEWWAFTGDASDRIYGENLALAGLGFRPLSLVIGAYQIYSTLISIFIKDYRTPEAFGHHISTTVLAFLALQPYANYYGYFFFGFTECTNLSLYFVDFFRVCPEFAAMLPQVNTAFRLIFAASFIAIRVVLWPYVTFLFWKDALEVAGTVVPCTQFNSK